MNDVVYQSASFMIMREPTVWRLSLARHRTDTLIVGRDPRILAMRPPRLASMLANFFGLVDVPVAFRLMVLHAGRLTTEEKTYRELVPAVLRQLQDPTHFVRRMLPAGSTPAEPAPIAATAA